MPYAAAIFLSAFLLFLIEPLLGKFLLPWFGGTPAVWTTCMLFFQIVLLLGYLYAHEVDTRLTLRVQTRLHALLTLLSLLLLAGLALAWGVPLLPGPAWRPASSDMPIPRILALLSVSVGLPFLVLSATSPLLQRWYARAVGGPFPYRLYALSNAGSLLGLLCYPFLVEPALAMPRQAVLWSAGYGLFVLLCTLGALRLGRDAAAAEAGFPAAGRHGQVPVGLRPRRLEFVLWVLLAAVASAMLLAVTNRLCQEIAAVPFLWVFPLVLYLLSLIVCFDSPQRYRRAWYVPALAVLSLVVLTTESLSLRLKIPIHIMSFGAFLFAFCMTCHGELVLARPPAAYLTRFYLATACGGALGGLFVGIVAPHAFRGFWEFDITVLAGWILLVAVWARDRGSFLFSGDPRQAVVVIFMAVCLTLRPLLMASPIPLLGNRPELQLFVLAAVLTALLAALFRRQRWLRSPRLTRLLAGAMIFLAECFLLHEVRSDGDGVVAATRNFYGLLRVQEVANKNNLVRRRLVHGQVDHGGQILDPAWRNKPIGYYIPGTGVGLALDGHPRRFAGAAGGALPLRIGVTGLGAGGLAAYARTNDVIRFYEINPAVIEYSAGDKPWFTYLRDCPGKVEIVRGDARLSQERELREARSQQYDVLILDAFSSDSVPVHLLTLEALETCRAHLRDADSIIAVNISNQFLDLRPLVFGIAHRIGMEAALFSCEGPAPFPTGSSWILLTRCRRFLEQPAVQSRRIAYDPPREIVWTDKHSDLFSLLRWR